MNGSTSEAPFLARFAVTRSAGETLPGGYDNAASLWTVAGPEGRVPLIAHHADLAELLTKTRVDQETDDTNILLVELTTKTNEKRDEGDDRAMLAGSILELTTKTHAQLESDDTDPRGHGLW
ncbi:hypothetical protein LB545_01295 [Mesorhizobium sp. BR1-1-6]|uniref:hypothetical protein n=1 Tax=Mesorhizobium sp. BR1-1-6 TaxID=2876648 RepID=UPI001CD04DEB|nr:hypothetical protein [Mesorhizobium sp. BR1-1-6]MBZ9892960.1 hypothetical protein [Mesorhizobium sp. BR1-1-6]